MAIEKVVYHYDDGTKREYPPRLTDLEQLEEFRKSKADIKELYEFMQEHLSKFEAKLLFLRILRPLFVPPLVSL